MNVFTLSNGLKVIHKEITGNPLISVQLFWHGGSINEKENEAGIANFTQGLLMQGTLTRDAETLAQEIEDIGGGISYDIEADFATLGISLMDRFADKGMGLLFDVAFHPSFKKEEIEKERFNVLASIKSRQDHIFQSTDDIFLKAFYGGHPYSWPDTGNKETVSSFAREDLARWHKKYFVTDDMLLVITGNVSLENAKELAKKHFAAAPRGEAVTNFPKASAPARQEIVQSTNKFKQAYIMIGFPAPRLGEKDYARLKVINALLGGRMSGRLFTELREKMSLAYEVNSFYASRRELSRFVVYMGLKKENLERAKKRIYELIDELKKNPVSAKELEETQNYIRGVYLLDHQTISRQAWYLGWWETMGAGHEYDARYLKDLMAVTSEDIKEAANRYFTDDLVQVELIPKK